MSCSKCSKPSSTGQQNGEVDAITQLLQEFQLTLDKHEARMKKHEENVKKIHQKHEIEVKSHRTEIQKLLSDHKNELEELRKRYQEEMKNQKDNLEETPLYKTAWKKFQGLSKTKKAIVILVLVAVSCLAIWGLYSFIIWAFPYVVSFVMASYAYLIGVYNSAATYLMGLPWFAKACSTAPGFCMEHSATILEAAGLGGGIGALVVHFLKSTQGHSNK